MKNLTNYFVYSRGPSVRLCGAMSFVLLMASTACAGLFSAKQIPSVWNDSSIKVDGDGAEWDAAAMTEKNGLSVSASNDEKNLYIYAAALDRDSSAQLSGVFKQTFTVWLDGKGGKKKAYGIKLLIKGGRQLRTEDSRQMPEERAADKTPAEPRTVSTVSYEASIVNTNGSLGTLDSAGVEFTSGLNRRKRPLFEFKIPLTELIENTGVVGVGFVASEIDESVIPVKQGFGKSSGGGRGGRGMGGGPGGGMGGGPGGDMGGGPPGGGMSSGPGGGGAPSLPDPIDFWLNVKLASKK